MHYRDRTLSPSERERTLRERIARGFPLHAPPHFFRNEGCYLITTANFEHQHIMSTPERRSIFEERLLSELTLIEAKIYAWVILTNHYHVLLEVNGLNPLSLKLKKLHGSTSREWNQSDGMVGVRTVWYRFSDRKIRNETYFYRALNYVHFNPVKPGYVESVYDWPWSSVHNYLDQKGREWLREYWRRYVPERMGRGWDD